MYTYRVVSVAKVVDGDTYDFDLDLGFYVTVRVRIRLEGVDTWEMWGKNAHELGVPARDFAKQWLEEGMKSGGLLVNTNKLNPTTPLSDGGFGRWAGRIANTEGSDLGEALIDAGFEKVHE